MNMELLLVQCAKQQAGQSAYTVFFSPVNGAEKDKSALPSTPHEKPIRLLYVPEKIPPVPHLLVH